jgi:hypothetical protein
MENEVTVLTPREKPERNRSSARKSGLRWAVWMTTGTLGLGLANDFDGFIPTRAPTILVAFNWIWHLVVTPVFFYGIGYALIFMFTEDTTSE